MTSNNHNNWITVGEIIKLVTTPVACYADHVLKNWHAKLRHAHGSCSIPVHCQTKSKCSDLCTSCQGWYGELALSHRNKNKSQIKWRQNCNTSKWPSDYWEVAKFFMSALGDNKSRVQDAKSTDLSYLLNVLEWMEDVAFGADRRVKIDFVRSLRSKVRNAWAHARNQEMADDQLKNVFDTANKFLLDLDIVFSHSEVKMCIKKIQSLKTYGLTNVVEAELNNLLLLRKELGGEISNMKEDIKSLKQDQNSDREVTKENEKKLKQLEDFTAECCKRMEDLQKWKQDFDQLFSSFHLEIESFRGETRKHFSEIKELLTANNVHRNESFELKSVIPERLSSFTGRETEVDKIISSLVKENCGIVSIVGGPGFGKSTIATEVSHQVSGDKSIPAIFSYLSNISTVAEVTRRLCHDVGVNPGEDPESFLMLWLRNMKQEAILVMDNIEQLLEGEMKAQFTDVVRMLRKNSNQQLNILTTSRYQLEIDGLNVVNVEVKEMDDASSVELLKTFCQNDQISDEYLQNLAELCGHVPLALCIVASRIQDTDPKDLLKWLKDKPLEALQTSEGDLRVRKAIDMSFSRLNDVVQKALVRLEVFSGNFDRNAAKEVLGKSDLETEDFLKKLTNRSLVQHNGERYQIHLLVKQFLTDHDQRRDEWFIAQELMVKHFLKVCQSWTEEYYSKDGCNSAKMSLSKEADHVKEIIRVCQPQERFFKPGIAKQLENSDIYKESSRFFYNLIRNVLSSSAVRNFLESCLALAKERGHLAIEINFQCLLADEEGHKSNWKSDEYGKKMENIKKKFYENEDILKEDSALVSHFNYCYGRYLSSIKENLLSDKPPLLKKAADCLELSRSLRENKAQSRGRLEKADEAITLIQFARLSVLRAKIECETNDEKYESYMNNAKKLYQRALSLTIDLLGDHELTSACFKCLGDLFLAWRKNEEALKYYEEAKNMSKRLGIYSNYSVINLLKNYGLCFFYLRRYEESVKQLREACDVLDKLVERDSSFRMRVLLFFNLAQVFDKWKPRDQEAVEYAKKALKINESLTEEQVQKMENIVRKWEWR